MKKSNKIIIITGVVILIFAMLYINYKIKDDAFSKNYQCQKISSNLFYNKKTNSCEEKLIMKRDCNFSISEINILKRVRYDTPPSDSVKELMNSVGFPYTGNLNNYNYILYSGTINNISGTDERIERIIARIYNEQNILITEEYVDINKNIAKGTGISYSIPTEIIYNDENKKLRVEIKPISSTCQ